MEDVLTQYALPDDGPCPLVCLDEKPVNLRAVAQEPLPVAPGVPERQDYGYQRRGTANLFVMVAPQRGWRQVAVTDHRGTSDYAAQLRYLAEDAFPDAPTIRLVQDNLNTHTLAALYATYPPEQAYRLAQRFELHPTPKHGSWLNMAEIEISVVSRGCLSRPVETPDALSKRVNALVAERNAARTTIDWRFSVLDARTKLHKRYPQPLLTELQTILD